MVSLVQVQACFQYEAEGWYSVTSDAPFEYDKTPIGGPSFMMNSSNHMMCVFADGSSALLGPVDVLNGDDKSIASLAISKNAWNAL